MANSLSSLGRLRAAVRSARDGVKRERPRSSQRRLGESEAATHARSRVPWRSARPSHDLTWGQALSGDVFVRKVESYGAFGSDKALLEIGPGYGRLVRSYFELGVPFDRYVGVDLSAANVEHLSTGFSDPRLRFVQADVETVELPERFDSMLSSLTLKHLYPSFESALINVRKHLTRDGRIFFDLIEASILDRVLSASAYFREETTFIRRYTRAEVSEILDRCGFELVAFDEVEHAKDRRRLLVVGQVRN